MKKTNDTIDLTLDLTDMSADQQDHRRRALRSMLSANEARQSQAKRSRLPTMAVGVHVVVKSGAHQGKRGTILDADFIHGRALIDFPDEEDTHWVEFPRLASDNTPS